ncbi:MAG: ABC transporter permease subunit [Chloroflexi bacterium]|nr:ABC transporter permease subunit [Chloroflexota bacterium]MBL7200280.1 ABC transporter permease subunit [Anaerolineae bacterium]
MTVSEQMAGPEGGQTGEPGARKGRGRRERSASGVWRAVRTQGKNPIVLKELRGRMRGWRAAVVLTVHLTVLSCLASIVYLSVAESARSSGGGSIGQTMGQALFYSTYMLLLTLVVFLSPAFTAGTISGERERKTLDLLITTLLPTRSVVVGKLASAQAYIVLLILAALPIQSLALMFGGIVLSEVLIGTLILLVTALIAGSVGIFVSSLVKSSIASTVVTYAVILLCSVGLPIAASIVLSLLGNIIGPAIDNVRWVWQAALVYVAGFLICANPFATAVATKLIEQEENTLLFFTIPIHDPGGRSYNIPLVSPWIVYVLFNSLLSALLIIATILVLRRKRG